MKFYENPSGRGSGAELFHADGQRDMTKLTVAFRNFPKATTDAPETHKHRLFFFFFFFFRRYNFNRSMFCRSQHTISSYCDPGCS
jgi:hypothetical protein